VLISREKRPDGNALERLPARIDRAVVPHVGGVALFGESADRGERSGAGLLVPKEELGADGAQQVSDRGKGGSPPLGLDGRLVKRANDQIELRLAPHFEPPDRRHRPTAAGSERVFSSSTWMMPPRKGQVKVKVVVTKVHEGKEKFQDRGDGIPPDRVVSF
jgi:hypothetical protein